MLLLLVEDTNNTRNAFWNRRNVYVIHNETNWNECMYKLEMNNNHFIKMDIYMNGTFIKKIYILSYSRVECSVVNEMQYAILGVVWPLNRSENTDESWARKKENTTRTIQTTENGMRMILFVDSIQICSAYILAILSLFDELLINELFTQNPT